MQKRIKYLGEIIFAVLFIDIDAVDELAQVDGIVLKHGHSVVEHHLSLRACAFAFGVYRREFLEHVGPRSRTVGVIVFLKQCAVVEILIVGVAHDRVVRHELVEQALIIAWRVLVCDSFFDCLEVGFAESLARVCRSETYAK